MIEKARTYGTVLFKLGVPFSMGQEAVRLIEENPALKEALISPVVSKKQRHAVIEKVFREPEFSDLMIRFLKKACDSGCIGHLEDMIRIARDCSLKAQGIIEAELHYVAAPNETQIEGIKKFLCKNHNKKEVILTLVEDPSLMGGFIVKAGNIEYDYSLKGQIDRLSHAVVG